MLDREVRRSKIKIIVAANKEGDEFYLKNSFKGETMSQKPKSISTTHGFK
jgi:hypothetical protein